jgi:hypothetical protein
MDSTACIIFQQSNAYKLYFWGGKILYFLSVLYLSILHKSNNFALFKVLTFLWWDMEEKQNTELDFHEFLFITKLTHIPNTVSSTCKPLPTPQNGVSCHVRTFFRQEMAANMQWIHLMVRFWCTIVYSCIISENKNSNKKQGFFACRILNNCERTVELDLELENSKLNSRLTWTGNVVFCSSEIVCFSGLVGYGSYFICRLQ